MSIAVPGLGHRIRVFTFLVGIATTLAHGALVDKLILKTSGSKPLPTELILANVKSKAGSTYDPRTLSEDKKRLFKTGNFRTVDSEVADGPGGTVVITLTFTPIPTVRGVLVEGNKLVKTKRLKELIEHETGVPVSDGQVHTDVAAIRKRYEDSSHFGTEVTSELRDIEGTDEVDIVYVVTEDPRHKLKPTRFVGNQAFTRKQLLRRIKTKRSLWTRITTFGSYFNEDELREDQDIIREVYRDAGYFDFRIERVEQETNKKDDRIWVTFHLDEGEPYTVSAVSVSGCERFAEDELLEQTHLASGQVYTAQAENADVARIRAVYDVLGYLDLTCYPVHTTDPGTHTVAIDYAIEEGVPIHIRDIFIGGNEITKDHVIRRELAIHPGDLGDSSLMERSRTRLLNLDYFESVEITPVGTAQEDERDIRVEVVEHETGQLMLGASISSSDSVVVFAEVSEKNFDWRAWPTLRGGGQKLRLRTQVGTERTDFILSFTEPWWLHRRLRLDLDLYSHTRYEEEYQQDSLGLGATVTGSWREYWRQSIGARLRQLRLTDFDDDVSAELLEEEGRYSASYVSLGVSRDSRNHHRHPTAGSRVSLSTEIISEVFGAYSNYARTVVRGTKYFPVFRRAALKLGAEAGAISRFSGDKVAIFDRFFAGGSNSVRGFKRRDISPVDMNEEPLGGKSMLLGTVEYIYAFLPNLRGSVFSDSGNVWRHAGDLTLGELNTSIGVGLQIDTPVGPVRLDYGWRVRRELEHIGTGGRFHFNLGYSF